MTKSEAENNTRSKHQFIICCDYSHYTHFVDMFSEKNDNEALTQIKHIIVWGCPKYSKLPTDKMCSLKVSDFNEITKSGNSNLKHRLANMTSLPELIAKLFYFPLTNRYDHDVVHPRAK